MLPNYILQGKEKRLSAYEFNTKLVEGDHYQLFNINESEFKMNANEYICYNFLKTAVEIRTDLIWKEAPKVSFANLGLQAEWDKLRLTTGFDETMKSITSQLLVLGDAVVKIGVDNVETSIDDEMELTLYSQNPRNWFAEYNPSNTFKKAKRESMVFEKEILNGKDKDKACLVETHKAGLISWTSYIGTDYKQVDPLLYFSEELEGVLADSEQTEFIINYQTKCKYSLLQSIRSNNDFSSYYGKSEFTMPVVSKINALNRYANLADTVVVSNSFPKLLAGDELQNLMKRIAEEAKSVNRGESTLDNLFAEPKNRFLSSQTYLQSWVFKQIADSKVLPNSKAGAETSYLNNPFNLEEVRSQHKLFFPALMTELGISEVFYNSELTTGGLSGVAYKRLMSLTLNKVDNTKRTLEPFLCKVIYAMLELGHKNSLVKNVPEMPTIHFEDGLVNDEKETLEMVILKIQNQLLPMKEAVMKVNSVNQETAEAYLVETLGETVEKSTENLEQSTEEVRIGTEEVRIENLEV